MKVFMNKKAALGMFAAVMIAAPGVAFAEDVPLKGMITSHDGNTIVVRGPAGDAKVQLTDATKIRGTSGALGVRGEDHPPSDLIRGLAVSVTTAHDGENVTATEVVFKNSDLKTAQQIAAGLVSTDENVSKNAAGIAANSERIDNVGLLVPAGRTKVFFAVGSAALTAESKQSLDDIATQAKAIKGAYRLAVVGRADTTGNAAANEKLSAQRAVAVKQYLIKSAGISPANFIPTTALGDAPVAQDPDPPANAAEARRVTVTIAVSKSSQSAAKN
jgi:outer membrane protein OmpA-like peptidoglycan-associated protein